VRLGELVWLRAGPERPTFGLVVNELITYLTDNSAMVSYEVLADSAIYLVDSSDVLQFHYYNQHLYENLDSQRR
jgi:hypothetical protein